MATSPTPVTIDGIPFVCLPLAEANFSDVAAIYVVLCVNKDGSWKVIDVGQSGQVGSRIDGHDRRDCWKLNCPTGNIWVCVYKMPTSKFSDKDRTALESKLRDAHKPACGKR